MKKYVMMICLSLFMFVGTAYATQANDILTQEDRSQLVIGTALGLTVATVYYEGVAVDEEQFILFTQYVTKLTINCKTYSCFGFEMAKAFARLRTLKMTPGTQEPSIFDNTIR